MRELANKLMAQARGLSLDSESIERSGAAPTAADQYAVRIGLWPLVSPSHPETAMGLLTALAFLLERYQRTLVYRLVGRADADLNAWTISQSQFDVDDWQVDGLDENVAVWGRLERSGGQWMLTLNVENDQVESDDVEMRVYTADNLAGLVEQLPSIAGEIAALAGAGEPRVLSPVFASGPGDSAHVDQLLMAAFDVERQLYRVLWGADWPSDKATAQAYRLFEAAQTDGTEFGAWLVSHVVARALLPSTREQSAPFAALIERIIRSFPDTPIAAIILAPTLADIGQPDDAIDLLAGAVTSFPQDVTARLALAMLYRREQRLSDMIAVLQAAIDDGVTDASVYRVYAELVVAMHRGGYSLPRYVLIESRDRLPERLLEEAAAAFERAVDEKPDDLASLQRRLQLLIELQSDALWPGFRQLVAADTTGEHVRNVVDSFELMSDIGEGLDILSEAVEQHSRRVDLRLNYAVALLAADDPDEAANQLEQAEALADDPATKAEIERLFLVANDPDFEMHLGEITDTLNAGKEVALDDIDYLEEAIESAPSFGHAYLLLARAYLSRDETGAALETLLDAEKNIPDDPDIVAMLARLLWDSDERELAFQYLNKALSHNPDHVPLLALTGRYLFEDDQYDEARVFLARADSLEPHNRVLREVKQFIARALD